MIWIIGANGMLGRELRRQCDEREIAYTATDLELDICSGQDLADFGKAIPGGAEWILNCSAYTAVDRAESEEEMARAVNATGVANIGKTAQELDAKVIHISTDYVFPGTSDRELTENDNPDPVGAYGRTKLEGEKLLAQNCPSHIILRTSWLYGRFGKNFVYTMINLMNSRDMVKVVNDQTGSPTLADDLACAIIDIMLKAGDLPDPWGIYHYSGEGSCTWYEFACEIYRRGKERGIITHECAVNPCSSAEYPVPAQRPAFSLLSKKKIRDTFHLGIPAWGNALDRFLSDQENFI